MRPYIFFEGGGGSDARRHDWAAPCLPPASHCSILFFKCRGGRRSSTKETRLLTRTFCLFLHAPYWVKQKDLKQKGLARREMLRRVPWSSPAAQPSNTSQGCAGLLTASGCSASALFQTTATAAPGQGLCCSATTVLPSFPSASLQDLFQQPC